MISPEVSLGAGDLGRDHICLALGVQDLWVHVVFTDCGGPQGRALVHVEQFLFGQMPELVIPSFRLVGLFPELIGARQPLLRQSVCSQVISRKR